MIEELRAPDDPPMDALAAQYEAMGKVYVVAHELWIKAVAKALLTHEILWADSVRALQPRPKTGDAR